MNPSSTLQYFKKPFFWKLGYLKLNKKAKIVQTSGEAAEVNLENCSPLSEEGSEAQLSLTAFKGELDSAVSQYLSQVKDLGYKERTEEGVKDQKLLAVKFKLDPGEIKSKSAVEADEGKEDKPKIKVISSEDRGDQTQLEVELPSLDNPLYITLSECSSGLFQQIEERDEDFDDLDPPFEHFYENGQIGSEDEHIYENVENSNGEDEEHLYDTLPRHKPDVPPKPDFLAQLAARQSEPVKRAWNPFVNLSVDTGETQSFSTASSLSSPGSHHSSENTEVINKPSEKKSNPFVTARPRGTSEQTLILDGSETSDLGSSGGEDDIRSVEDWPLPPTPPPGEDEYIGEDNPLPPPPPELALQELEEAVIREEEEERKIALQKEKEAIERQYGAKLQDFEELEKVEAVNKTFTSFEDTYSKPNKKSKEKKTQEIRKEPKIIQIDDDDYEEFNTPAIRHSVIIALKDSCPSIPHSIKPSEIRRKESLKRSESLKKSGIFRIKDSKHHIERRESIFKLFPLTVKAEPKISSDAGSISVGVISPKQEKPSFSFLDSGNSADQVIEISEDGSWEMKHGMDNESANQSNNPDVDPFTGNPIMAPPIMAPPVSPLGIPAPPSEFQTNDGMDGVYAADIVTTHSGPSSLASTITDSTGSDSVPPATPTLLTASEAIPEESYQDTEIKSFIMVNDSELSMTSMASTSSLLDSPATQQKNLGVAIMEGYETELQKKKDSMNLPELSLLEFGDSVRDLEEQRRSVIKQMTVKAKKKDTWIKTCHMHAQGNEGTIPVAPSRARRKTSPNRMDIADKVTKAADFPTSNGSVEYSVNTVYQGNELEIPKISNLIETINDSIEKSRMNESPKYTTEPEVPPKVLPPKVLRKNKQNVRNTDTCVFNVAEIQESISEEVISPKNTEALAALFSSPVKITKPSEEENQSPPIPPKAKEIREKKEVLQSSPEKVETDICADESEVVADICAVESKVIADIYADESKVIADICAVESKVVADIYTDESEVVADIYTDESEVVADICAGESKVVADIPQEINTSEVRVEELVSVTDSPPSVNLIEFETPNGANFDEDSLVKEKNEINKVHSAMTKLGTEESPKETEKGDEQEDDIVENVEVPVKPTENIAQIIDTVEPDLLGDEGEVEYFSILDNKSATKTYWESRMLATMDDGGWESVANVRFQPVPGVTPVVVQTEETVVGTVTPPPEFIPAPPPQFDNSPADSEESAPPSLDVPLKQTSPPEVDETPPATKKYVYGVNETAAKEKRGARIVETVAKKPSSQENVIEAEIMAQQMKEDQLRQEVSLKHTVLREKGASSPASHDSDEGFVDRLGEDVTPVSTNGYTHTLRGHDGEPVIYDAVSPPPEYFASESSTPTPSNTTETKIALEIRELKEREEELRQMRAQLTSSRDNLNEDEETRSSASREQLLEDHLTSFTTTTDEGNYSECGDPASSEDKSSDGSNSRIMSPELLHPSTHLDFARRKVTVKPFEEDEEDDQPVYLRMQKESVIEREIRLAREREEAFRREKGLTHSIGSAVTHRPNSHVTRPSTLVKEDPRDVQHRMATSRIQLEIQETCEKEKELRDAGKILTTSEETVDAKVTRMSDFTDMSQIDSPWNRTPSSSSTSSSPSPRTHHSLNSAPSPALKRSPSPRSPSSPVPTFALAPPPSRGMTKSLSTTNLASPTSTNAMRAPKGLMQKFIASRGKMTTSAFSSPPPTNLQITSTSRGIPTRPMRVEPKAAVLQRETLSRLKPVQQVNGIAEQSPTTNSQVQQSHQQQYRRSYCTAEEKIQSELKEMQMREEELRRLRARQLAQSQPNLAGLALDEEDLEVHDEINTNSLQEVNGLRTVLSNPNLLDDEPEQTQAIDKGVRRRSALIAQWENRIQKTADT